jgi:hypothetical protein
VIEYLSDHLKEPDDFFEVLPWDKLTTKSQFALQRAIERSDILRTTDLDGFNFDLLSRISIEDLNDARFIGPARAKLLIQELVSVFEGFNLEPIKKSIELHDEVAIEGYLNFSELFQELDKKLLRLPKADKRAIAMLKHRHLAFGEPGLSLDEIGKEWRLTRERVRQIVNPLMEARIELKKGAELLTKAVELLEQCEDEEQFVSIVEEEEIFGNEEITWKRLWGLAKIMSSDSLATRIYKKHLEFVAELDALSSIRGSIKKDRSKFGLYDLQVVTKRYKIDEIAAFKIILSIYPRAIKSGNLVLARTQNIDTMFENSIAKQLKVSTPLSADELLKGLQRSGRARDVPLIGSTSDLSHLIHNLAGTPPNYSTLSHGLIEEIDFQSLEKWLIEIFSGTHLGLLHSNDVVNFALRDKRINVSSITVYLLNSPIIRSYGRSLYSLVGTVVTQEQLDDYIQIIRGTAEASEVSYEMTNASKGILSVKPNLNVITSGIVFPPAGYKKIFEGFEFETSCTCGYLETIQAVKFSPSGFWTGFTAMIRHGFSQHQMSKGSTFRFEFDFDSSVVRLLVS